MATNPMQRKSRTSFFLGMLLMLIIAAIVVALLYMKIQDQQKKLKEYTQTTTSVYVLNQDVKSGQVLTSSMFMLQKVATTTIPVNATADIATTLASYSLSDTEGRTIYFHPGSTTNAEDTPYYYYMVNGKEYKIYITDSNGNEIVATNLNIDDKAYFYAGENNTQKVNITVAENAIIAKVDMNAKTVITTSLIDRADERTTDDLRKEEYNIIDLPVDLVSGEYVDIRLVLPNGENFIVVSKKQVTIPISNGVYLPDTIQMNLREDEILTISCAIIENYKIAGSKLYATRYTEAGIQEAAAQTYVPSTQVIKLIKNDPNAVKDAVARIEERNNEIDSALNEYGNDDNVSTKVDESKTSTKDARKNYLQSLTPAQ